MPDADIDVPEWEYNAAARYYWEKLHQWFTEEFAPKVEALIHYQYPQQPTKPERLESSETWTGKWWDQDSVSEDSEVAWLYKMQGGFDGHVYPMIQLDWDAGEVTDMVHERDRELPRQHRIIGQRKPLRLRDDLERQAEFTGYHPWEALKDLIQVIDDARNAWSTPWTNFDAMIYGPIGHGGKQGVEGPEDE